MAVYVDAIRTYPRQVVARSARKHGARWCHMGADTHIELLAFAKRLGLPRGSIQDDNSKYKPHYDLTPARRAEAVRLGAEEVDAREYIRRAGDLKVWAKGDSSEG